MKKFLLLVATLLPLSALAQSSNQVDESVIYDSAGKKIFSLVPTGQYEETTDIKGVRHHYRLEQLTDLETGRTYTYSDRWREVTSNGLVVMDYHFNKRLWYWVEDQGARLGKSNRDAIQRVYDLYEDRMNTHDQGDTQILRYKDGGFLDEMGREVYSMRWHGSIPSWVQVVLLHKYYEQVYLTAAVDEIKAYRVKAAIRYGESDSLAKYMLALGHKYETKVTSVLGRHYDMLYFTEIDGQIVTLKKEQIQGMKNKWLVENEKTRISLRPFQMPRGGHYLSKRDAKKRGVPGVIGTSIVIELKPAPEFVAEFRSAISNPSESSNGLSQAVAARQAVVDSLTVGILAGNPKKGMANGYRTNARLDGPGDVAVDSNGNVFFIDSNTIRKISADGQVSTLAGSYQGFIDGAGITARFKAPQGIAIDSHDNLYVADTLNHSVRKISPDGYVSTLVGQGSGYADGRGPKAKLSVPVGIAVDGQGNVYVSERGNRKIRKITPDGTVTTIGDSADIKFRSPRSIAVDKTGNVYVLDGAALKRIAPDGSVFMMAPNKTFDALADGKFRTLFRDAGGIAVDLDGNLLLTKTSDQELIRIAPSGESTTVASNGGMTFLGYPTAIAIGTNGNIYLADERNHLVQQITPAGNTGPLPGTHIPKPPSKPVATASIATSMSKAERKAAISATKKLSKKDPQAMYELANLYDQSGNDDLNQVRAMWSYKKAAKKGHPGALYELALRHLNGQVSYMLSVRNGDVAAGKRKQQIKRQTNAAEFLTQSAEQGYAPAQYAIGQAYLKGEGVAQNADTALSWTSKAGEQGMLKAQLFVAKAYQSKNTAADSATALRWFGMAAAQGDTYATVMSNSLQAQADPQGLGATINADAEANLDQATAYYSGSGVPQDLAQAAKSFHSAALLGNSTAQWKLGLMYLRGEGVDFDPKQGIQWLSIASELNHPGAQFNLGLAYDRGYGKSQHKENARYWFLRAAEQGQVNAQFMLGIEFYDGKSKNNRNKSARRWLEAAAEQGDAASQYLVAQLLYVDPNHPDNSPARSAELLEKSAAQGFMNAAVRLSDVTN